MEEPAWGQPAAATSPVAPVGAAAPVARPESVGDAVQAIVEQMQQAGRLVEKHESDSQTSRLHEEILRQLDALVARLPAPEPAGQSGLPPASAADPQQSTAPATTASGNAAAQGAPRPAGNAASAAAPPSSDPRALMEAAWGHLPPEARRQIEQLPLGRFLPKYQRQIEDYFRRLAEEADRGSP